MLAHLVASLATLTALLLSSATKMDHSSAPGETKEAYTERLTVITSATAQAARVFANGSGWTAKELAFATLVLINEESRFDLRIHNGDPHPLWHSDHGRSKCLAQVQKSRHVPPERWLSLAGTSPEATYACLLAGTELLVRQAKQCGVWNGQRATRDKVAMAFAAYASGGHCRPTDRDWRRANLWNAAIGRAKLE